MTEISTSAVGVNNTKSESCYSNGVRNYVDMVATFFQLKSDLTTILSANFWSGETQGISNHFWK